MALLFSAAMTGLLLLASPAVAQAQKCNERILGWSKLGYRVAIERRCKSQVCPRNSGPTSGGPCRGWKWGTTSIVVRVDSVITGKSSVLCKWSAYSKKKQSYRRYRRSCRKKRRAAKLTHRTLTRRRIVGPLRAIFLASKKTVVYKARVGRKVLVLGKRSFHSLLKGLAGPKLTAFSAKYWSWDSRSEVHWGPGLRAVAFLRAQTYRWHASTGSNATLVVFRVPTDEPNRRRGLRALGK